MAVATTGEQPAQVMQGIAVPATSVNAPAFYAHTRRQTLPYATGRTYSGLGTTDIVTSLQTGILSQILIRVSGAVTTVKGAGTVATKNAWPYGLLKNVRFTANGQSNLINVPGIWLKAREMARTTLNDRDVRRQGRQAQPGAGIYNGNVHHGSLSLSNEVWGTTTGNLEIGPEVTAIADGTYNYDIHFVVPVAFDEKTLVGSIFAQTQATELALSIDWASSSDLFTFTNDAAATVTAVYNVEGIVYDIPQVGGQIIVPNLSMFHSLIMNRNPAVVNGDNEFTLPGQGVGRQLMRIGFRTMNGASPAPLPLRTPSHLTNAVAANYGNIAWRYGGNQTPDLFPTGRDLANWNERTFGVDFSSLWGIGWLDFSVDSALRDSVDEGTATQLRLLTNIDSAVALTSAYQEVVQETLFGAAAGG